ncbi:alpha/beta fold hydrolase [Blastococcus sp. SYSU D00820]
MPFFAGFAESRIEVGDGVVLRVRTGGSGPPVVLLHGHPRTHTTWHRVAPLLAAGGHTVVCPDLRGYGRSSKPPTAPDHAPYGKRAMAGDVVALMRRLGHERFAVVDCIPIVEHLDRADARFATAWCQEDHPSPHASQARRGPLKGGRPGTAPCSPGAARRWARRTTTTTWAPSATRPPSRPCSRTTAPA